MPELTSEDREKLLEKIPRYRATGEVDGGEAVMAPAEKGKWVLFDTLAALLRHLAEQPEEEGDDIREVARRFIDFFNAELEADPNLTTWPLSIDSMREFHALDALLTQPKESAEEKRPVSRLQEEMLAFRKGRSIVVGSAQECRELEKEGWTLQVYVSKQRLEDSLKARGHLMGLVTFQRERAEKAERERDMAYGQKDLDGAAAGWVECPGCKESAPSQPSEETKGSKRWTIQVCEYPDCGRVEAAGSVTHWHPHRTLKSPPHTEAPMSEPFEVIPAEDYEALEKRHRRLEQSIGEVERERDQIAMDPKAEELLHEKDREILLLEQRAREAEQRVETLREALVGDEAVQTLYAYVPNLTSDNDAGPDEDERQALVTALEAVADAVLPEQSSHERVRWADLSPRQADDVFHQAALSHTEECSTCGGSREVLFAGTGRPSKLGPCPDCKGETEGEGT